MWPLLEEYPSMSSPPRATSPVHFPHSSLPVREISQGNARIRLPLATTSSITMYDDNRFAKHPRFRFFALNTEMRWRALQTRRVYVKQHPGDAQLSLDELRDMVGREGQTFSNRVSTVSENTKTVICCSQKLACTSV